MGQEKNGVANSFKGKPFEQNSGNSQRAIMLTMNLREKIAKHIWNRDFATQGFPDWETARDAQRAIITFEEETGNGDVKSTTYVLARLKYCMDTADIILAAFMDHNDAN